MAAEKQPEIRKMVVLEPNGIELLVETLRQSGYETVGPKIRHNAVVLGRVSSIEDLPIGWGDVQGPGTYRLVKNSDQTFFGYGLGPQGWKKYLHPSKLRLWQAHKKGPGFQLQAEARHAPRYALIGVRPCESAALESYDTALQTNDFCDPVYVGRRSNAFVLAVNCTRPGNTCFCASMGTGPRAVSGFDIALTEIFDKGRHCFAAEAGTPNGAGILGRVAWRKIDEQEAAWVEKMFAQACENMGCCLDTVDLKALFDDHFEHSHWETVARRCLACGSCTLVCPTCFCTNVVDAGTLDGSSAERHRYWDSCFTREFSYIHGGSIRESTKSRYRQWLTHKLATWTEQFDSRGCVGCGRCITWCPVGIDITEEARTILKKELSHANGRKDVG